MSHHRTVYVIDRDLDTRRSLALQLGAIGAEAWPFSSGPELLLMLDHLSPGCILLDLDLPGLTGLEVLESLGERRPAWPVVALSSRNDVALAVDAMKLGALDFLPKPVGSAALAGTLAPAWSKLETSIEEREVRRAAQERVARLTAREVDIALALLGGRPNKMVAHLLGISVRTVEMHRAHILAKLGVKNLAEAAVLATRAGLAGRAAGVPQKPKIKAAVPPPCRLVTGQKQPELQPRFAARRLASRSA